MKDLRAKTKMAERLIDVQQTIAFSHLTAARRLGINEFAVYGLSNVRSIVPEIVLPAFRDRRATGGACRPGASIGK